MTDPLNTPIPITYFTGPGAQTADRQTVTMRELAKIIDNTSAPDKPSLPWLKLATFGDLRTAKQALRHNANMLEVTGIELDYDDKTVTPADAARRLRAAGVAALVYTSPSHTLEAPKWRVLAPLSQRHPPAMRYELAGRLNAAIGGIAAGESFTDSQAFYFGETPAGDDHHTTLIPGKPLDECTLEPVYPARKTAETLTLPPPSADQDTAAYAKMCLDRVCAEFSGPGAAERRHYVLLSVTLAIAPFVLGGFLDYDTATETIRANIGRPTNDGEIEDALDGGLSRSLAYVPATGDEFDPLPPAALVEHVDASVEHPKEITEDHAARLFAAASESRFRFDHSDSKWYEFTPAGWDHDETANVIDATRVFLDDMRVRYGIETKEAMKAANASFIHNVASLARVDRRLATSAAMWDADPWHLGVPGGYVDLRTGSTHTADPSKLMRRRTTVAPSRHPAPIWTRFLHEATGGDVELTAWLQRWAGYVLTGDVSEEMFAFIYGPGKNGKGVFTGAIERILGNYALAVPAKLFDARSDKPIEYWQAQWAGARLLRATETESGSVMAESFIKEITGNEGQVSARPIRGSPFTYTSQAKILIVGNHAPKLAGRSEAMERRLRVVPFNNRPPVQDHTLKERLEAEYPQILQWMIDGCIAWQAGRLGVCAAVKSASATYFEEQDTFAQWLAERCDTSNPDVKTPMSALLEDYNGFLQERGERRVNNKDFRETFKQRFPGNRLVRTSTANCAEGLSLSPAGAELVGMLN